MQLSSSGSNSSWRQSDCSTSSNNSTNTSTNTSTSTSLVSLVTRCELTQLRCTPASYQVNRVLLKWGRFLAHHPSNFGTHRRCNANTNTICNTNTLITNTVIINDTNRSCLQLRGHSPCSRIIHP